MHYQYSRKPFTPNVFIPYTSSLRIIGPCISDTRFSHSPSISHSVCHASNVCTAPSCFKSIAFSHLKMSERASRYVQMLAINPSQRQRAGPALAGNSNSSPDSPKSLTVHKTSLPLHKISPCLPLRSIVPSPPNGS